MYYVDNSDDRVGIVLPALLAAALLLAAAQLIAGALS